MECSEPTPVLPIVSTSHALLAAHVNLRRNKMMLPKYYHTKALGGSSTKLPPRDAIVAIAIFYQSTRGLEYKTPPERRHRRSRDLHPKRSGARVQKLPPRNAIVAHAIFTYNHLGARAPSPPERRYRLSGSPKLKGSRQKNPDRRHPLKKKSESKGRHGYNQTEHQVL